uniref:agamous-like MADS-box protein AGL62 n=1 Tax=Erigeron canadensis TaxID=72917 RepID=UPI001CB94E50|nr:agamous-like MADS-box protein AGL62 [Erigeron canadensis]
MEKTNTNGAISNMNMNKKTTKGRKKIEIKKIEEQNTRQVTFSKRRNGLFKKASELCILTGAQAAIIVSSPAGRMYAFGHPDADHLIDTYLNNNNDNNNNISTNNNNNNNNNNYNYNNNEAKVVPMNAFNQHYVKVSKELEAEKKRKEMIPSSSTSNSKEAWYEKSVEGMDVRELEEYLYSLGELKKRVLTRADELLMINQTPGWFGPNAVGMGWRNGNHQMGGVGGVPNYKDSFHGGLKFGKFL